MKLNFLFVCDTAEISEAEKKLDVTGIFDSIGAKTFPATHPFVTVVAGLEVAPEERNKDYIESFEVRSEDTKVVIEDTSAFRPTAPRHQFLHRIQNLGLPRPGTYTVTIKVGGKPIGDTYFLATQV